jgi:hypothetical protein
MKSLYNEFIRKKTNLLVRKLLNASTAYYKYNLC